MFPASLKYEDSLDYASGGGPNMASVTDEITLESFVSPAEGTA